MEKNKKMRVVVIGGVAAGPKTAARLRRINPEAEIAIIERGKVLSYAGCGLPYFVGGDIPEPKGLTNTPAGYMRDTAFFRDVKGIEVLDRTNAEAIDRSRKTVSTVNVESGEKKTIPYDKLVLATGGTPVAVNVPGIDLRQVYRIYLPEDAIALRDAIFDRDVKNVSIVGAGLIGMEMAEAFVKQGVHVSMVEMMPQILPGVLDEEISAYLLKYVKEQKIDVHLNTRLTGIVGDSQGNPVKVQSSGPEIPADMVVIAVGVRPNSKLARDAGLELGPFGDIKVNEFLQTSDPDIYAGGDCVGNVHKVSGKTIFAPMGSTANKHGRIIADNIMGAGERWKGVVGTSVVKVFRYNVGKTGLTENQAREAGFDAVSALVPSTDVPHYYPTSKLFLLKLTADRKTRKLLGFQGVGPGEVAKRIDVLAACLNFGGTLEDLADIDLGYAPPYSTAIDISATAANVIRNKLDGIARSETPAQVNAQLKEKRDFIFLDVRSAAEHGKKRIDDPRVKLVPLHEVRRKAAELPRDKKVVTLCKAGLRAYEAQAMLEGAGLKDVTFMDGGIEAWPFETRSEEKKEK